MWRQTGENIYRDENDQLMIARSFENELGVVQTLSGLVEDADSVQMPVDEVPVQVTEEQKGFWETIVDWMKG